MLTEHTKCQVAVYMCTGILKATVSRYLCGGSSVYGCLVDASKAFDTVDRTLLLEKLIERGLPIGVTRFILSWYQSQQVQVHWRAAVSEPFPVTRGVRQGGVLSPILFSLCIDDLLMELAESGVGCHWDGLFVGALANADDLTLLAPSPSALRTLLGICERFGAANFLKFSPDKTQCIRFSRLHGNSSCHFVFCGKIIERCNSVTHLGHTLTANLMDGDDIFRCSCDFVRKANGILIKFEFCDPFILTKLLTCFCLSLYGCALWSLDSRAIKHRMSVKITAYGVSGLYRGIVTLVFFMQFLVVIVCLILVINIFVICIGQLLIVAIFLYVLFSSLLAFPVVIS